MDSAQFSRCVFPENVYSSKPAKQIQIQATNFILSQLVDYLMDVVSLCAQNTNRTKFLEAIAKIQKYDSKFHVDSKLSENNCGTHGNRVKI